MIIVNFKTYESAIGQKALELAKIHDKVAKDTGKPIIIAVQPSDIYRICQEVSIPVYAQHADNVGFGSNTGWILPEALREAGAAGTLLNHSEHRFKDMNELENTVKRVQEIGLRVVVCAENDDEGAEISKRCKPEYIAVEPPELIGGDISISTAQPELIKSSIQKIGDNVLVGAGVKTAGDIKIAMEFGAKGVLLASGITKAKDPEAILRELVSAL